MTGMEIIALLSNSPTAISVVSSVVGGLFTTIFLRRNTSVAEFEKIKNGQFKEVADSLLKAGKMTYVEYYQASNFLEVAKKADKYYSEIHHDNNNANYDFDWFVRFYEAVGNISDEVMQELWAKLLAGEVAEPSSFSLKTIDVLRNLSKKDAELFSLICSHSVMAREQNFLPHYDTYLEKHNIYYTDIMKLNEQGLIFNDSTIGFSMSISQNPTVLFWNNDLVMTIESSDVKNIEIRINTYPFTKAGQELAVLVSKSVSEENFIELAKEIANKNQECNLGVYKIVSLDEKSILHDGKNLLESISNNEDKLT
jgi:membrane-fusion protein